MSSERAVGCRCGKRWFPTRYIGTDMHDTELQLAAMALCSACSADVHRRLDMCPESVPMANGISACSLGWHHTGECQPAITVAQQADVMRRAAESSPVKLTDGQRKALHD